MTAITRKMGAPAVHERMATPAIDPPHLDPRHRFRKIRVGVYVIQRGRLRYADEPLAKILGYAAPQALIDRPFWQWVHPEDRARVCLVKGQTPFRCITDNGAVRWVQMSGVNSLYNAKPANVGCLVDLGLDQAFEETFASDAIIGESDAMRDVCHLVQNLADLETTVLVTGEHGTGKELIAKSLHCWGRRAAKPFVRVNCSALAESLLERQLFGCARDAFTEAPQDTCGRVQAAEGGTIILDDIGDMTPAMQARLLRIMQEKSFERVGESVSRKVDVRIVACTRKDLRSKVKSGEFREDLYRQLKLAEIALPPLRERLQDVPLLAEYFRRLFNRRFDSAVESISGEALERLMAYHWPWNVRELENAIERAIRLCPSRDIAIGHLPPEIRANDQAAGRATIIPLHTSEGAQDLLEALSRAYWNRTKAADLLGVSRQTLYRKIRAFKIFEMM